MICFAIVGSCRTGEWGLGVGLFGVVKVGAGPEFECLAPVLGGDVSASYGGLQGALYDGG